MVTKENLRLNDATRSNIKHASIEHEHASLAQAVVFVTQATQLSVGVHWMVSGRTKAIDQWICWRFYDYLTRIIILLAFCLPEYLYIFVVCLFWRRKVISNVLSIFVSFKFKVVPRRYSVPGPEQGLAPNLLTTAAVAELPMLWASTPENSSESGQVFRNFDRHLVGSIRTANAGIRTSFWNFG